MTGWITVQRRQARARILLRAEARHQASRDRMREFYATYKPGPEDEPCVICSEPMVWCGCDDPEPLI